MSDTNFDAVTKVFAGGTTRRGALGLVGRAFLASLAVGAVTATGSRVANAAPKECLTCCYGTGKPCNENNPHVTCVCSPATAGCPPPRNPGQPLCGSTTFHCPRGCP